MSIQKLELTISGDEPPKFGSLIKVSVGDHAQNMRVVMICKVTEESEWILGLEPVDGIYPWDGEK